MHRRSLLTALAGGLWLPAARAHHGWSSFDTSRPLFVEGRAAKVAWRNPHAEFELMLPAEPRLPADLATRALPAQSAAVDGAALLKAAQMPIRADRRWQIELAPLTRMDAWKVPPIQAGETVGVLGFALAGEKADTVLRAEYLFLGGKVYAMRSSPA